FTEQPANKVPGCSGAEYKYLINAPGRTKYLTWNPAKFPSDAHEFLYPQTGPWLGLLWVTESGFSLKKNVSQSDIGYSGPIVIKR
ncbi:MAG TPA: hypothetical protein VEL47_05635, partial [Myxococcota bacterium]|nr:hypothetical protein [Myxococcota bacterium]